MANPYPGGYDNGHQLNDLPGNVRRSGSAIEARLTFRRAIDHLRTTPTTNQNIHYCTRIPHISRPTMIIILDP